MDVLATGEASLAHFDLAHEPFQFIVGARQSFDIIANKKTLAEIAKDLVDMSGHSLVLLIRVGLNPVEQLDQVMINRLRDTASGWEWLLLRLKLMIQVNQPLTLATKPFHLIGKRQAMFDHRQQAA